MKICDISKENYPSERFSMLGPDVLSDSFMMKNFRKGSYLMFVYSAS